MLKEMLASNAGKLVAACVCPVVAGTVALKVPPVRSAIHKATAPQPKRTARAKPRIRVPAKEMANNNAPAAAMPLLCAAPPVMLNEAALKPASLDMPVSVPAPDMSARFEGGSSNCAPVTVAGGGTFLRMAAVPEPATWAQMIAGFALAGAAVRRRRRSLCHIRVTSLS
ncbi:PEPxxWA-CTERM sorting domain-containing protein [Sphingomonas sp.]|jgi:hypothetical protein|uniref:PEPxxWA-CTERM sorting domain-containing protein n=1 Tax=Sphingomonas sp. TaxID=28214 RepID=UPI002DEEC6EF|nr:PEPxxWA-CTERM sorting domain-containing protein [Sphingomonas sp.]